MHVHFHSNHFSVVCFLTCMIKTSRVVRTHVSYESKQNGKTHASKRDYFMLYCAVKDTLQRRG